MIQPFNMQSPNYHMWTTFKVPSRIGAFTQPHASKTTLVTLTGQNDIQLPMSTLVDKHTKKQDSSVTRIVKRLNQEYVCH